MKTLQYKVTLLSDVILNQKAATEGPNKTLDFIPGSCFLGIVSSQLYQDEADNMIPLFHSNVVRFGDAHPAMGDIRSLRVPAAMYYPKLGNASDELYISHMIPDAEATSAELRKKQLKQCRSGFYDFSHAPATPIATSTSFAIKSAHDCQTRASKTQAMFGYESLRKGLVLYFSVEVDQEGLSKSIEDSIKGIHRVGRSRSAQYGLVEIEPCEYNEIASGQSQGSHVVYADSRLIFLDETATPTFRPTGEQLGIPGGTVNWEKSQIRTFRYANWNAKRQCFDTDRCGLEKGSVLVVDGGTCPTRSGYVGSYQNEGFGHIIYNPAFLEADANGIAHQRLQKLQNTDRPQAKDIALNTPLLKYLKVQKTQDTNTDKMYRMVNEWVEANAARFTSKAFASQWGTIRALASVSKSRTSIQDQLFAPEAGYLMHGIGKTKWEDCGRRTEFKKFVSFLYAQFDYEEDIRLAIVNLAAEMAKRCKKEDKE